MKVVKDRIASIESRAQSLNLTLEELCRKAEVPSGTLSRWKTGRNSPQLRVFDRTFEKLEAALDREIGRLRDVVNPQQEAAA